jgi:hypothetical protein
MLYWLLTRLAFAQVFPVSDSSRTSTHRNAANPSQSLTGRTSWMSFQSQGAPLTPSRYSRTFDLPTSIKPNA